MGIKSGFWQAAEADSDLVAHWNVLSTFNFNG